MSAALAALLLVLAGLVVLWLVARWRRRRRAPGEDLDATRRQPASDRGGR